MGIMVGAFVKHCCSTVLYVRRSQTRKCGHGVLKGDSTTSFRPPFFLSINFWLVFAEIFEFYKVHRCVIHLAFNFSLVYNTPGILNLTAVNTPGIQFSRRATSVADPDLEPDPKDPNHFAGSERYFLSVGTSTIKSCKTNFKELLRNMIFYFIRKNEN